MNIISCNNITISFGTRMILENASFQIQDGEKAGFVGANGAGKSTLFKIITGTLKPDGGDIYTAKGAKTGFLEQNSGLDTGNTILEELVATYSHLIMMEGRLRDLEDRINQGAVGDILESLVKEHAATSDRYGREGGFEYNSRIKGILMGLGFGEDQFGLKVSSLSGGQKTRLALARILLQEPDILLLDEPTNHLDMGAIQWLEDFLKSYRKSVLVISHDRYFLDQVTTKTVEIENRECKTYPCKYSEYVQRKALDREVQQKHYELQQKEIARMEAFIEQQRRWNREKNIIAAESRQKAIDRMAKIDRPKALPREVRLEFRKTATSGIDVLRVEHLSKGYPGKPLFKDFSFSLIRDDRAFLLGPNGCGKSTLLRILAGYLQEDAGSFEFGHNVHLGYYDQEQADLDMGSTILEEVWSVDERLTQTELRNALARFLFTGEDVYKPISVLSGGEKSRVALLKLILSGANLLVLDEPTNHLDINSREALEDALEGYDGTILAVSHDRYFIRKLSNKVLQFEGDSISSFQGNYEGYLSYKAGKDQQYALESAQVPVQVTLSKQERLTSKEERARLRRLEKQLAQTEENISSAELRLSEILDLMEQEHIAADHVKLTQLCDEQLSLKCSLEEWYLLWEDLSQQLEDG